MLPCDQGPVDLSYLRAPDKDDSLRADTPLGRYYTAHLLSCARLSALFRGSGGSRRVALGVRAISPHFSQVFGLSAPGSELSRAGAQRLPPSWFLEVFGARRRIPPQPLFLSRTGLRSPGPILPIIFGVWKCYYFSRAPFAAPERRAKRAASSATGHAPHEPSLPQVRDYLRAVALLRLTQLQVLDLEQPLLTEEINLAIRQMATA
ncbi:hypothetical protein NDU88_006073 [Pleurodeles waltl]|uniref:Uncharacterized protein n=1 Tax=Pleurodeles waltl TaxID=8319 RepID=A0AAV7L5X7_PLEWA|nr:hypothetical protein NDU88_006073 [Pleurodeles waltl]